MLFGRKGHAAIDHDPLPAAAVAEAVDREIHPDLAEAAERRENKLTGHQSARPFGLVLCSRLTTCARSATGKTSPAIIVCSLPSASRSIRRPLSSRPSK